MEKRASLTCRLSEPVASQKFKTRTKASMSTRKIALLFKDEKDDDKFANWIKFDKLTEDPYEKGSDGKEVLKPEFKYFMQCVAGTNPGPNRTYIYEKDLKDDCFAKKKAFEDSLKDHNLFQDPNAFRKLMTKI